MIDFIRYRLIYFALSGLIIGSGVFALLRWGINLGFDFTGGTVWEIQSSKPLDQTRIQEIFKSKGLEVKVQVNQSLYSAKISSRKEFRREEVLKELLAEYPNLVSLRFETLGPKVGSELIRKTLIALTIATIGLLLYIAYRFKGLVYGLSAILAVVHDTLVLIGSAAILGKIFGFEVDLLYVTAVLTTISFSLHDTVVVFDRIREIKKKNPTSSDKDVINQALNETFVRSINTSITIILMLFALLLLSPGAIKNFVITLFIGSITGTYSSIFIASPLIVTFEDLKKLIKHARSGK